MFKNQWPESGSTNWMLLPFCVAAGGCLAVTIAAFQGAGAMLWLLRCSLMLIFIGGGGIIGLLFAQHFANTHLKGAQRKQRRVIEATEEEQTAQRGYLALFGDAKETRSAA